jgi:hypothetical protein
LRYDLVEGIAMGSHHWNVYRHIIERWGGAEGAEHVLAVVGDCFPQLALYTHYPVRDVDAAEVRLKAHHEVLAEIGALNHPGVLCLIDVMKARYGIVVCRSHVLGVGSVELLDRAVPMGVAAEILAQLAEVGAVLDAHTRIPAPAADGVVVSWDGRVAVDPLRLDLLLAGEWPARRGPWVSSLANELGHDPGVGRAGADVVAAWLRAAFPEGHARDEWRIRARHSPSFSPPEPPDWP